MAEYIEREAAYDMDTLYDWYISSVSENDNPVWTEEHLEELLNDFYVIPKDTTAADVVPVRHGEWQEINGIFSCSRCGYSFEHEGYIPFLTIVPTVGARMDGDPDANGNDNKTPET